MDSNPPEAQRLLDLKLIDLLAAWPSSAQTLIAYRMACIGCDFASFHTARQAIDVYQLDPADFLQSLQAHLQSSFGERRSDPSDESS